MTNGNHWDVSDGDIQVAVNHAELEAENEYDYDEIEYMPPKQPGRPISTPQRQINIKFF